MGCCGSSSSVESPPKSGNLRVSTMISTQAKTATHSNKPVKNEAEATKPSRVCRAASSVSDYSMSDADTTLSSEATSSARVQPIAAKPLEASNLTPTAPSGEVSPPPDRQRRFGGRRFPFRSKSPSNKRANACAAKAVSSSSSAGEACLRTRSETEESSCTDQTAARSNLKTSSNAQRQAAAPLAEVPAPVHSRLTSPPPLGSPNTAAGEPHRAKSPETESEAEKPAEVVLLPKRPPSSTLELNALPPLRARMANSPVGEAEATFSPVSGDGRSAPLAADSRRFDTVVPMPSSASKSNRDFGMTSVKGSRGHFDHKDANPLGRSPAENSYAFIVSSTTVSSKTEPEDEGFTGCSVDLSQSSCSVLMHARTDTLPRTPANSGPHTYAGAGSMGTTVGKGMDRLPAYYSPSMHTLSNDFVSLADLYSYSGGGEERFFMRESLRGKEVDARHRISRTEAAEWEGLISLYITELFMLERSVMLQRYFLRRAQRLIQVREMEERCGRKQIVRDCASQLRRWHDEFEATKRQIQFRLGNSDAFGSKDALNQAAWAEESKDGSTHLGTTTQRKHEEMPSSSLGSIKMRKPVRHAASSPNARRLTLPETVNTGKR